MINKFRSPDDFWSCKNLILDPQERVMICRRVGEEGWSFPRGDVRLGEAPIDATTREVKEHIGMNALDVQFMFSHTVENNIEFVFICKRFVGEPKPNESILEFKWEYFWYLASYNLTEESKITLDKYYDIINS